MSNWNVSTLADIWYNVKIPGELYLKDDLTTTNRADEAEGFSEWTLADELATRFERMTGIRPNIVPVDMTIWL